jgi:acyl carrier protein
MSDTAALTARTVELIRDVLHVEVPGPDTDLVDAGLIDSLALIALITELELEFGIQLPTDQLDLSRFRSAEQMAALVVEHRPDGLAA